MSEQENRMDAMSEQEIRERLIKLEVILGDERRGLIAEIEGLRREVGTLKAFQLKVMGGFGVLAIVAQLVIQTFLK